MSEELKVVTELARIQIDPWDIANLITPDCMEVMSILHENKINMETLRSIMASMEHRYDYIKDDYWGEVGVALRELIERNRPKSIQDLMEKYNVTINYLMLIASIDKFAVEDIKNLKYVEDRIHTHIELSNLMRNRS